jgi:hypothetical protein
MKPKQAEICESFTYKVTDYDHVNKIYTLKNIKTGEEIKMVKYDFDARLAEQQRAARKNARRENEKAHFLFDYGGRPSWFYAGGGNITHDIGYP